MRSKQHRCHSTNSAFSAQHVWRYLIGTKNLAIRASADIQHGITSISTPEVAQQELELLFYGASDAAFADEPETSRSSQGYLFKLYGLPIDWKATVQRSITKSTTEAELLSLSLAGSEMEWCQRFFQAIRFDPEFTPSLWCDNQQTVAIETKTVDKLQTKLKHVDVHHQWVRQEISEGRLQVEWKTTAEMPANGLTKILSRQKHASFNRIVQRNYRKKLKKRLEDLERHAASSSASPEQKPAKLQPPQRSPR
ncbi:hypothetical protein L13192_12246 [Pyrenophora tritici-repentis]|nr:hypothetical protein L13192_12246 [Pyrenophora tritici-repentis]